MAFKWTKFSSSAHPARVSRVKYFPDKMTIVVRLESVKDGRKVDVRLDLKNEDGQDLLVRMLGAFDPPADFATMEKEGVEPEMFVCPEYGDGLIDRRLMVRFLERSSYAVCGDKLVELDFVATEGR